MTCAVAVFMLAAWIFGTYLLKKVAVSFSLTKNLLKPLLTSIVDIVMQNLNSSIKRYFSCRRASGARNK